MDLVSVIIPYFKKKDTILSSINSVLDQTYKNFEIIIVYDDESESDWNFVKEIKNMDQDFGVVKVVVDFQDHGLRRVRAEHLEKPGLSYDYNL